MEFVDAEPICLLAYLLQAQNVLDLIRLLESIESAGIAFHRIGCILFQGLIPDVIHSCMVAILLIEEDIC